MAVRLLFFAQCADWIGLGEMNVPLENPTSLESFLKDLSYLAPVLKNRRMIKIAVNQKLADVKTEIKDNDEIAFLPPYSGG